MNGHHSIAMLSDEVAGVIYVSYGRIDLGSASVEGFFNNRFPDAAIGTGYQNCLFSTSNVITCPPARGFS